MSDRSRTKSDEENRSFQKFPTSTMHTAPETDVTIRDDASETGRKQPLVSTIPRFARNVH